MLSENIKNLRKSKGLSQEGLAMKLNVVRQTVSKWENGYRFRIQVCSFYWRTSWILR